MLSVLFGFHLTALLSSAAPTDLYINESCKLIINALPTFPWHSESFSAISLQTNHWRMEQGNEHIKQLLFERCRSRYYHFLHQHFRNIKIITNKSIEYRQDPVNFTSSGASKKMLHILDLDETILDAKFRKNGPCVYTKHPRDWRRLSINVSYQNSRDLHFGIHSAFDPDGEQYGYLVVFRQYLMHYIHKHRDSANFIIYSLADIWQIIPPLTSNYIYKRVSHSYSFKVR